MTFSIRPANSADLGTITRIYQHEVLHGFVTWNEQPYSIDDFQKKLTEFNSQNFPFFCDCRSGTAADCRLC